MRSGKQNISKKQIELEIYKTFEFFKAKKDVTIADFLKKFDVSIFGRKEYRKIKFSYESLVKLILFQKLKGIKFYTKLTKYLRRNPKDKYRLGFSKTPDRTQIGYFINHILDKETKEMIDFAVDKILEISEKFGILFDVKTLEPEKPKKKTKKRNRYNQKRDKAREIARLFKKRFAPFINLNLKNNTLYKKNQFIDLLIHMGMTRDFAENGSKTYIVEDEKRRVFCPKCNSLMLPDFNSTDNGNQVAIFKCMKCGYWRRISPNADTLLYHLKNYPDYKDVYRMFTTLFEIIWDMTRKANLFDPRKRYDVAIDFTEWYFYGDRGSFMVVGKEPDRGTSKCYKFITLNIVEAGKRFTMLALPVSALDNMNKDKLIRKLLGYALKRIKIRQVYVDRGFFDSKSIRAIELFHLKYLMPARKQDNIQKLMEITPAPSVITDFILKNVKTNLVFVNEELDDGKTVKRVFATNESYDPNDVPLLESLFDLYGKRWGIETSYRVKKHSYLPKTTSKNYFIRMFYFMFAVLLYNLWILADILLWLALFGKVGEDHLITSKLFGTILYTIDSDSGE